MILREKKRLKELEGEFVLFLLKVLECINDLISY